MSASSGTGQAWSYMWLGVIGGFLFGTLAVFLHANKEAVTWTTGLILQYAIVLAILSAFGGYVGSQIKGGGGHGDEKKKEEKKEEPAKH